MNKNKAPPHLSTPPGKPSLLSSPSAPLSRDLHKEKEDLKEQIQLQRMRNQEIKR